MTTGYSFAQKQPSGDGRLFIRTSPVGASIRILSIKPKFQQGILLKPGSSIDISADGYETRNLWITVEPDEERTLEIALRKKLSSPRSGDPDEWVLLGIDY